MDSRWTVVGCFKETAPWRPRDCRIGAMEGVLGFWRDGGLKDEAGWRPTGGTPVGPGLAMEGEKGWGPERS